MFPRINGKDLLLCDEDDLSVLIDNPDYRENEYLDYKQTLPFLELPKGNDRNNEKTEFKCDVCSFANADGGYLVLGINDNNGCATEIVGIAIPEDNTDRFELDRRNDLNGIQPKTPDVQFGFIKLKNGKYIVVMQIKHDVFAPYLFTENEKNYKVYKRYGNGKRMMSYNELRLMFNQSFELEGAISQFVSDRIKHYQSLGESFGNSFVHLCFIPETFIDSSSKKNMFVLEQSNKVEFSGIFNAISGDIASMPCMDGLRYIPFSRSFDRGEGYIRNNGIVEACLCLDNHIHKDIERYPNGFLAWKWLWDIVKDTYYNYVRVMSEIEKSKRFFICLSIVGCQDVSTNNEGFWYDYYGKVDREIVTCDPIDTYMSDDGELVMKRLYISYLLSIGVKYDENLKKAIEEVYSCTL